MSEHSGDTLSRHVDLTRAIIDVEKELASTPPHDHIQLIPYAIRSERAQTAFLRGIQQHIPSCTVHESLQIEHASVDHSSLPSLFQGNHLLQGFTLGLYVTQQAIGKKSSVELAKHVERVMDHEARTPRAYAKYLTSVGDDTYIYHLSSDSQVTEYSENQLHQFVDRYTHELYGTHDFHRQIPFKVGVGIARTAFNLYSRDIDIELSGIEAASHEENSQA